MADTISTGVKITVDASDIKNKFTKSVDELNASLSKNQKTLGLVYNEQGILTNALGQTVEGLSQSSIKLGQYVDELGRVRTFQGGFTDGLTKTQIELGLYVDELGNVRNRLGEVIGLTDKAAKAQEAEAAAALNAAQQLQAASNATIGAFAKSAKGISKTAGQLAIFQQLLIQTTGSTNKAGQSIAVFASSIGVAAGSFKSSLLLIKGLSSAAKSLPALFTAITTTSTAATPAVATLGATAQTTGAAFAAMGGPITLALASVAAIGAGVAAFKSSQKVTQDLSESFKVLEERAKAAGVSIRGVQDALNFGAFRERSDNALVEAAKEVSAARDALSDANKAYHTALDAANESRRYATGSGYSGPSRKAFNLDKLDADYKNAIAKYNEITEQYVQAAKEAQKTQVDKLQEQRANYAGLLKVAEQMGNEKNADVFRRQIELIDGQIKDVRDKELEAAKAAQEATKNEALASVGIADYLKSANDKSKKTSASFDNLDDTLDRWNDLVKAGTITQEEYNAASAELTAKLKGDLFTAIGVSVDKADASNDAFDKLQNALDKGVVTQEEYNAAVANLKDKAKTAALKELGVNVDETPLTFGAKTERLDALLQAGTIKQDDYNAAIDQLTKSARQAVKGLDEIGKERVNDEAVKDAIAKYYAGADLFSLETLRDKVADAAQRTLLESFVEIENAFKDGVIKEQERDKLLDNAYSKLAQARDDEAKAARQEIDKIRQNLGIDSLLEELKTPLDKYYDALDEIAQAMKQGAIQENERQLLTERAAQKYLDALNEKTDFKELSTGSTVGKGKELANRYNVGSEALYVAQVRQATTNYQSAMQSTTASIKNACVESLNESRLATQYLEQIAEREALQTWG